MIRTSIAVRPAVRLRVVLCVLGLAAAAAGCEKRPDTIPDDRPVLQLSTRQLGFAMDAYAPASFAPAAAEVLIANSGAEPLSGAPTVTIQYLAGEGWLSGSIAEGASGFALDVRPAQIELLAAGTYQATLSVAWAGAANSPAAIDVQLTVGRHAQTWQTGPRSVANVRWMLTTTALADGGALSAGGMNGEATMERLDPARRTWSSAGALRQGRYGHTATLLADGRVFIAGGQSQQGATPGGTWEIYDPAAGRITEYGSLANDRYDHAAVLLRDGRVLLMGGWRREGGVLGGTRSCEIFDPVTRVSTETGAMHGDASEFTTAALLHDGRVLVITQTPEGKETGAELFDPGTGEWTVAASRPQPRIEHATVALADGRVLVFGGMDPETTLLLRSSELYDPETHEWTTAGDLHSNHAFIPNAAALLPSGKVLVAGGGTTLPIDDPFLITEVVETFDPDTGAWTIAGALQEPLIFHVVTVLGDGSVWAMGGAVDVDHRPEFWHEP